MGKLTLEVVTRTHEPIGTSRLLIVGRPSLVMKWTCAEGEFFGEATPLSGYGDDDFELARSDLTSLTESDLFRAAEDAAQAFDLKASGLLWGASTAIHFAGRLSARMRSKAAKFCVETLVLGAAARRRSVPLWRLLSSERVAPVLSTSVVCDPLLPDWQLRIERALSANVRAVKIKCGRDPDAEKRALLELSQHPSHPRLRLDPNQAWSLQGALEFLHEAPLDSVDFVEDPTADRSEWSALRLATGVQLAVDEPLTWGPSVTEMQSLSPDVFVLKPMALGGFSTCLSWALSARQLGARVSVSHLFDGPVAMRASIHLAFAIQSPDLSPGLGVHAALGDERGNGLWSESELCCPEE